MKNTNVKNKLLLSLKSTHRLYSRAHACVCVCSFAGRMKRRAENALKK